MKIISKALVLLLLCAMLMCPSVAAADGETLYNAEYCFHESDFGGDGFSNLAGIFVTAVPDASVATVRLGGRTIRAGDVLPTDVLDGLRLQPTCKKACNAVFAYQPICGTALGTPTQLTIRIKSGKNETPKAIGGEFETYKNIANDGKLSGSDPEDAPLTFQLAEKPKRGTVQLGSDGAYVYTPDKNKVGEDSFTFTVTDEAGNVSKPATVKIRILKPSEEMTFADLGGSNEQFEALWLCERGLTSGKSIAGTLCFCPQETLSRAEFLVMAMNLSGIDVEPELTLSAFADAEEAPAWVQPYLAAAMRRGLISGETGEAGLCFRPNDAITEQEAAVMLQNMLDLPVSAAAFQPELPAWSAGAVEALAEAGLGAYASDAPLTRLKAASLLYRVSKLEA